MPLDNVRCSFCTNEALYTAVGIDKNTGEREVVFLCLLCKDKMEYTDEDEDTVTD